MDATYQLLNFHNDTALARLMGVSRQTISRWRADPDRMPLGSVRQLAKIHGYSLKLIREERGYEA